MGGEIGFGKTGTNNSAVGGGKDLSHLPVQDLVNGSVKPSPLPVKVDPNTFVRSNVTSGKLGAQLPIMGNSESSFQQGMNTANKSIGSPETMLRQLSPASARGSIGAK